GLYLGRGKVVKHQWLWHLFSVYVGCPVYNPQGACPADVCCQRNALRQGAFHAKLDHALPGPLDEQREAIFQELGALPDAVLWYRPGPRVWSIGEHLDHSRVNNCCLRRFMIVYYPLPSVFARLFRHRPYKADIEDLGMVSNYPLGGWIFPPKYT